MKKTLIPILASVFVFTGCGYKKIDTSTDEQMKKSVQDVRDSLPEADRDKFDDAIKVIMFSDIFTEGAAGAADRFKETLNGKTGAEVIAAAQSISTEREAKERKEALDEIAELRKKRDTAEHAKIGLAKFKVTRSRFYKRKDTFDTQPIIELSLENDTTIAVSRAYFTGTLASPGRTVPWLKKDFNYQISGGMEPGEKKDLELAPNMFSDWGTVDVPSDAILTVEVKRIDGADGNAAFDAETFSDDDATRLKALEEKFPK